MSNLPVTHTSSRFGLTASSLLLLGLCACGGDESPPGDGGRGGGVLRVISYNAGLARSFVDYAVERTAPVASALAELDVDVQCVQEVWEEEDWQAITSASPLTHTHRLEALPDEEGSEGGDDAGAQEPATCRQAEVDPLEACVRSKCDVPAGELTSCALSMCSDEVSSLAPECLACITGVIGDVDIDVVLAACGPGGVGGGSAYAYGGSFGIGILSGGTLSDRDSLVLDSTTTRRAILHATIKGSDGEPVHLFCTHLTAKLDSVPYTGDAGSWAEENAEQIGTARTYMSEKAGDERYLLIGDLNTGPAVEGVEAELPENYALLSVLDNPYVDQKDASCTFCPDNPLQGVDAGAAVLIDHIMLGNWTGYAATGQRILDGTLPLEVDGKTIETAHSDHYGVRLEISN